MLRTRSFALAAAALLLAASLSPAAPPGFVMPHFVPPANTYHYPSARDFVSPANRTTSNYFVPPQSYYLHPYNAEPNVAPRYPPPAVTSTSPIGVGSPLDVPLVPRALREPPAPTPEPAEIEVRVPAGAEIWFSGEKTKQTGTVRLFRTPPLEPGTRYAYNVKARWTENGKEVERTLHVPITAGGRQSVTFRE
jgi:uncharacterized protein (TIGR03000 family)